ncbi:hypothetical protein C3432_16350 [Citrobacter amalonaticus]|uniref:Uncharacterized protein n=1 Tax=Citrobacter amalonaticus TaxID=35703 RepID=A0A2S4RUE1_CITAM|nr:hypothetical protein C3432_16350 [Citrobacter amalonaticus]POT72766.1 hypothetical protein C3436_21535 [Citrobacter amalonaticus]POU63622.1 hypothetical protein C3430_19790 [Citrobacter amalonaticus]POV03386.1 hypothetical protein C3424_22705 [Citrobacter amalonaticus]
MSLMVSRFCILFSHGKHQMMSKRVTLFIQNAMGKVWFIYSSYFRGRMCRLCYPTHPCGASANAVQNDYAVLSRSPNFSEFMLPLLTDFLMNVLVYTLGLITQRYYTFYPSGCLCAGCMIRPIPL